jgi:hypothetical protein
MSKATVNDVAKTAKKAGTDIAWAQWSTLSPLAVAEKQREPWSIIDPEALLLLSLSLMQTEGRLSDLLISFARAHASLISVQRITSLVKDFPERTEGLLSQFAVQLVSLGDKRWVKHIKSETVSWPSTRPKDFGPIRLTEGPALMLRLRAGFGVGAKADLLAFLLGMHGTGASLPVLSIATGYTERTLRRATDDMVLAGLIHRIEGNPTQFYAYTQPWAEILESFRLVVPSMNRPAIPPWRFWSSIFAFLAQVIDWAAKAQIEAASEYVASSRARTLMELYEPHLKRARIPVGSRNAARGASYLEEFAATVESIASWSQENL